MAAEFESLTAVVLKPLCTDASGDQSTSFRRSLFFLFCLKVVEAQVSPCSEWHVLRPMVDLAEPDFTFAKARLHGTMISSVCSLLIVGIEKRRHKVVTNLKATTMTCTSDVVLEKYYNCTLSRVVQPSGLREETGPDILRAHRH